MARQEVCQRKRQSLSEHKPSAENNLCRTHYFACKLVQLVGIYLLPKGWMSQPRQASKLGT
jgi:hypothetical protein